MIAELPCGPSVFNHHLTKVSGAAPALAAPEPPLYPGSQWCRAKFWTITVS